MESVLHPSSLHLFAEIYPNKSLNFIFGKQLPDSSPSIMTRPEDKDKQRKQQRRQTMPTLSVTNDNYGSVDYQDKDLLSKRYQRWSWTASSTVLPMETIQEEEE